MAAAPEGFEWVRAIASDELDEGRVMTAVAAGRVLAITHYNGSYGAFDNRCPHNGGPLGEGSIEHGLLRCPWHGYDYDALTGQPPASSRTLRHRSTSRCVTAASTWRCRSRRRTCRPCPM